MARFLILSATNFTIPEMHRRATKDGTFLQAGPWPVLTKHQLKLKYGWKPGLFLKDDIGRSKVSKKR